MPFHDNTPPSVAFGGSLLNGPAPHTTAFGIARSESQFVVLQRKIPTSYRIIVRYKRPRLPHLPVFRKPRFALSRRQVLSSSAGLLLGTLALFGLSQYTASRKWATEVSLLNKSPIFSSTAPIAFRAEMVTDAISRLDRVGIGFGLNPSVKMQAGSLYRKSAEMQGYGRSANRGDLNSALVGLRRSISLLEKLPENSASRRELAVSLQRLANVQSQAGEQEEARAAALRAIALLSNSADLNCQSDLLVAYTELSSIEQRMGLKDAALASARNAIQLAGQTSTSESAAKAQAYERLALAINAVEGPKTEAVTAANTAVDICREFHQRLESCQTEYFVALDTAGQIQAFAGRHQEALKLYEQAEPKLWEMASQDPNNHLLLDELRRARQQAGVSLQAVGRTEEALRKFELAVKTAKAISSSGSAKTAATNCPLVEASLSYASLLMQQTTRMAEGQSMWKDAKQLLTSSGSNCKETQQAFINPPVAQTKTRRKSEAVEPVLAASKVEFDPNSGSPE